MAEAFNNPAETFFIRKAYAQDAQAIRALVRSVRINPLSLDWRRFVVAIGHEQPEGREQLIGCGQIKPHADGTRELASIAVKRGWRRRGVARAIIHHLMASQPGPLYLTCRARLGRFYESFGFQRVESGDMPAYYRRITRITRLFKALGLLSEDLWVMRAHTSGKELTNM